MQILQTSEMKVEILNPFQEVMSDAEYFRYYLKNVERAGRTCYKTEDAITEDSYKEFVAMLAKRKHLAMIEFGDLTLRFITDRGVTHEVVRHRLASYAQESTRYCNYSKGRFGSEIVVFEPPNLWKHGKMIANSSGEVESEASKLWRETMEQVEEAYMRLIELGVPTNFARSVLPNALKAEICMKANFREWLHFISLRAAPDAHPQMQVIAKQVEDLFRQYIPEIMVVD